MSNGFHYYEPRHGHGLPHDPFNAIVGPRPIGWISTRDTDGRLNLAPYSFFNAFNYTPPIVGFSSIGYKDTVRNVEATGEFVWNLTTRALVEPMNATCASVPPDIDEFELAGLTPVPSTVVGVPRVGESPVAFECRVIDVRRLQTADGVRHGRRRSRAARRRAGRLLRDRPGSAVQAVPTALTFRHAPL